MNRLVGMGLKSDQSLQRWAYLEAELSKADPTAEPWKGGIDEAEQWQKTDVVNNDSRHCLTRHCRSISSCLKDVCLLP